MRIPKRKTERLERKKDRSCRNCGSPIPSWRRARAVFCSVACKEQYHNINLSDEQKLRRDAYSLKYKFGLTVEQYEALLASQGGCAICDTEEAGGRGRWHVDHATGKVRGLLCHKCNVGLGHFDHDPELLMAAADYLERHT